VDRVAKLKQASQLINEVLKDLNINEEKCEHCARTTYANWDESQAHDQLTGVLNKLMKWTAIFEFGKKS
jgi:hypothetical protein